jgi:hypothetical protein
MAMAEILYAGAVPLEEMPQIVAACNFEQDARFLAENIPTHLVSMPEERHNLLRFTYVKEGIPYSASSSGRIFQEDRELRWERQKDQLRVVYLGPPDINAESVFLEHQMKSKEDDLALLRKSDEPKLYALFGERIKEDDLRYFGKTAELGDFAVVRIPRVLRYPVDLNEKPAARLLVCEYRNKATGNVDLFRFQAVEAWNDKKRGGERV